MFSNLDYLRDCINSLRRLTFDKSIKNQSIEVLVVCNSSLEKMQTVQQDLAFDVSANDNHANTHFKWLCMGYNTGFVGATNAGIKAAEGEYIVFLNDDTRVEARWLSEMVKTQLSSKADMVASSVFLGDRKTLDSQGFGFAWRGKAEALTADMSCSLSKDDDYWLAQKSFLPDTRYEEPFGPDGAAALYTRKLISKVGMLEKDFFAYLEDVDLAIRARQQGMFCSLAKDAVVYHYKHATSSRFSKFKSRQDMVNWRKIVMRRYDTRIWLKFWSVIFFERLRNISGYVKSGLALTHSLDIFGKNE